MGHHRFKGEHLEDGGQRVCHSVQVTGGGGGKSTWPLKNCVKTIIAGTLKHVNTVKNSRYYKHIHH